MLAIVAGSCFLAYNFSPHHKVAMEVGETVEAPVKTSDIFTTLYFHAGSGAVIAGHDHGDHGHDGEDHGDDHGYDGHYAAAPLVAIAAAIFDGDATQEGTQLVLYNLQIFQLAALLMILVAMSGVRRTCGPAGRRRDAAHGRFLPVGAGRPRGMAMGKELSAAPAAHDVRLLLHPVHERHGPDAHVRDADDVHLRDRRARAITFVLMIAGGIIAQGPVNFFKHLVPDVPLFLWPMLFVIEPGLLIKPVALMIRLFATMTEDTSWCSRSSA